MLILIFILLVIDIYHNFNKINKITVTFMATGGHSTPATPFVSVSPLELVTKNFHATAANISFSQVSICVPRAPSTSPIELNVSWELHVLTHASHFWHPCAYTKCIEVARDSITRALYIGSLNWCSKFFSLANIVAKICVDRISG